MIFKNLLFGIGGTAVVGGVGYGIYASSQANEKDEKNIPTIKNSNDEDESGSQEEKEVKGDNVSPTKEDKGKSTNEQGEDSGSSNIPGSSGGTPGGSNS